MHSAAPIVHDARLVDVDRLDYGIGVSCARLSLALALVACASAPPPPATGALAMVASIHGGAGPWAVAGFRMGEFAIAQLGLARGSFDLEVTHFTPREVQYSCIADGAAAATGASLGKLNLTLADAALEETRTVYRRRSNDRTITLRLTAVFRQRYLEVPREKLAQAGAEVLLLSDEEIFERVPD